MDFIPTPASETVLRGGNAAGLGGSQFRARRRRARGQALARKTAGHRFHALRLRRFSRGAQVRSEPAAGGVRENRVLLSGQPRRQRAGVRDRA